MTEQEKKELEISEKKAIDAGEGETTRENIRFVPDVDIVENEEAVTLWIDLPGVDRDAIDIDLEKGVLTVTAGVTLPPEGWKLLHADYDIGGFSRRFTLGDRVDQEKISARYDAGVLTLVLPKAEEHRPRKIAIGT